MAESASPVVNPVAGCVRMKWPFKGAPPISLTKSRSSMAIHDEIYDGAMPFCVRGEGESGCLRHTCSLLPFAFIQSMILRRRRKGSARATAERHANVAVEAGKKSTGWSSLHWADRSIHWPLRSGTNDLHIKPFACRDHLPLQLQLPAPIGGQHNLGAGCLNDASQLNHLRVLQPSNHVAADHA